MLTSPKDDDSKIDLRETEGTARHACTKRCVGIGDGHFWGLLVEHCLSVVSRHAGRMRPVTHYLEMIALFQPVSRDDQKLTGKTRARFLLHPTKSHRDPTRS